MQNLAPVGFSLGRFREVIELPTDRLLVFPRMPHVIHDVVADWIITGDDELIERLLVFTDGSSVLSKGWPAEPAEPVSAGCGLVWLAKTSRVSFARGHWIHLVVSSHHLTLGKCLH